MHLGGNWEKFQPKIHMTVENIISTNLRPKDISTRIGQDHYILIFDESTTPEQAEAISLKIGQKIRQVFIGESESSLIEVKSQVGMIQKNDLNDIIFVPDESRPATLASAEASPTPEIGAAMKAQIARLLKKEEATKQGLKTKTAISINANNIQAKRKSSYEVEFVPFWNIHNEVLTGYAVTPVARRNGRAPLLEHNVLSAGAEARDFLKLDTHLLKSMIEVAAELYQNDFTSLLTTQVHFETLSCANGRSEILSIARQIPASLKSILMIEVVGIPDHTPPSTVLQRASGLNTLFRVLTIRVPRLDFPAADCVAMGATAISYKIPPKYSLSTLLQGVTRLITEAKASRLFTTFEYVPDVDIAEALKDAGAVFISGAFLGGPFDTPGNIKKLTVSQARQGPISPY